jgi:hypothetical protein
MSKIETDGLMEVKDLAALRSAYGAKSATEQGIRTQIRQIAEGKRTSKQVGFEFLRFGSAVMVRLIDPELLEFQKKYTALLEKIKPK